MSLNRFLSVVLFTMVLWVVPARGQEFTDQGMFSGSGLTILPTATIAPPSEFRLQYARLGITERSRSGMNIISLSTGFSSSVEGYSRFIGEQAGSSVTQETYGFGLKVRAPFDVPLFRRVAVWVDRTISDRNDPAALYPTDALRYGAIATLDSNGIRPTLVLGMSSINNITNPLAGAGVTIAISHSAQLGFEAVNGYFGKKSMQVIATGSVRLFANVSALVSPGYLSTPGFNSWTVSFGLTCSTADVDFHPVVEQKQEEEITVPSIEDIQREEKKEQKSPGDGGALDQDVPQVPSGQDAPSDGSGDSGAPHGKEQHPAVRTDSGSPQGHQQENVPHA